MTNLIPIGKTTFSSKSWSRSTDYFYAAEQAVCPVEIQELPKAMMCMPLAFMPQGESFSVFAVLGLSSNSNYFVDNIGNWTGKYVPARFRVYPFVLAKSEENADELIFCFDSASGLLMEDKSKELFFEKDGELTSFLTDMMRFLATIDTDKQATIELCKQLEDFGLIQPWSIEIKTEHDTHKVKGLFAIDEAKLNTLDDTKFLALRESGALALAYFQMLSMQHIEELKVFATDYMEILAQTSEKPTLPSGGLNFDNF